MIRRPPFWGLIAAVALLGVIYTPTPAQAAPGEPKNIVLLMDTSGSMSPVEIEAARKAAEAFVANVPDDVPVGLMDFDSAARVLVKPTTDRGLLVSKLPQLQSGGGTALYASVLPALREVGSGGSIVILSDGQDTAKSTTLAEAQAATRSSGASLDAVAFTTRGIPPGLTELVDSGQGRGQVVQAKDAAELAEAFKRAALISSAIANKAALDAATSVVDKPLLPLWAVVLGTAVLLALALFMVWPRKKSEAQIEAEQMAALQRQSQFADFGEEEENANSAVLQLSKRYVASRGLEAKMALTLDRAGLSMKPSEWVVLRVCAGLAVVALLSVLTKHVLLSVVLGILATWALSTMWLRFKQNKRTNAFADQLPDTLQIVASSLRSGFSLNQALSAAHERGLEPMSSELGRALAAARIGANLEDELDQVGYRMASEDWRWAVMAIRIQRNVGGNLAEVLMTTAHTLRERAAMGRQVRALSAEGRLSAYILIVLPLGIGAFLLLTRRDYIEPLWTTFPGMVMLTVALGGIVIGWFWMKKIVVVKV